MMFLLAIVAKKVKYAGRTEEKWGEGEVDQLSYIQSNESRIDRLHPVCYIGNEYTFTHSRLNVVCVYSAKTIWPTIQMELLNERWFIWTIISFVRYANHYKLCVFIIRPSHTNKKERHWKKFNGKTSMKAKFAFNGEARPAHIPIILMSISLDKSKWWFS